MPQSLSIGAFVFGAVLVLLSLVVGKFKLFGAEVDGSVGKVSRVIAFLFGLFLISKSLNLDADHPAQVQPQPAPASTEGKSEPPVKTQNASITGATNDGQTTPRQASRVAEEQEAPPAQNFEDYLPGVWHAKSVDPNTGVVTMSEMRFVNNGIFSGTISALVGGYPQSRPFSGTWSVRTISADRFAVTLNYYGGGVETHPFRVIDHNSAENQDNRVVAHRVSE